MAGGWRGGCVVDLRVYACCGWLWAGGDILVLNGVHERSRHFSISYTRTALAHWLAAKVPTMSLLYRLQRMEKASSRHTCRQNARALYWAAVRLQSAAAASLARCVPCTGGAGLVLLGIRAAAAYSDSNVNATALHSVSWVVVMLPSAIFLCCFWGMMASSSTPVTLQLHEERVKRVSALCCCVLPGLCTLILLGLYLNELEADGGSAPFDQLFVVTPMFVAVGCIALGLVVTLIRALREHDDEDAGITLWALYGLYICAGSMFAGVLLGQAVLVASMLAGDPNGIGYTVSLIPALLLSVVSAVGAARYGCRVYCTRRMLGHPFLGYLAHAGGPVQGCCGIFAAYGHSTNTDVGQLYAMYEHEAYIGSQLARLEQAFLDAPVPESVRGGLDAGRAWMMDKAIPV